jgi:hypothetical protein
MTGDPIPMNQLMTPPASVQPQPPTRDREGTVMLLHEALARCRQQEAEQAAREYALARSVSAGRRWARLARFASRRAEQARAATAGIHVQRGSRAAVDGLRSAV